MFLSGDVQSHNIQLQDEGRFPNLLMSPPWQYEKKA
jgi:hypothetical protein